MGTGSCPMELEFPAVVNSGISTEPEVRWWYVWTADKVERMGSTAVRYLIQWMSTRTYTLECTQQAGVSDIVCTLLFFSTLLQCLHVLQQSGSHIANKPDYSLSSVLYGVHVSSIVYLKKVLQDHMVIMKLCALKHWLDYSQCRWQQGGEGSLPQAPSVRGPLNSARLIQIRSSSSVIFPSLRSSFRCIFDWSQPAFLLHNLCCWCKLQINTQLSYVATVPSAS